MSASYPNLRVQALIDGHTSIDSTWTEQDFIALSLAALDQAGASIRMQNRVAALFVVESLTDPEEAAEYARLEAMLTASQVRS